MNIYIGQPIVVSDMQGPAPKGFHIPLMSEWKAIYNAYKGLGFIGFNYFSSYLKLPKAGYRDYNKSVYDVGSSGNYWSSTTLEGTTAIHLRFTTSSINPEISDDRSRGCTVRCIQDSPTIPTASWTTLYQGSGSAGIFRNQTDGLISISSDGTTWYTLMDKNLGATTVYNYGDTLTDANCGSVFQWGNNYAFPGTKSSDSITTSSTRVDTTGYGPGNYYESSTWITTNPRHSSANDGNNLRGGVSKGTSTKTQELQNAYIGEYGWKPGANTLAYYPFISDLKDYSGNGYDFTTYSGTTTFVNNMVQSTGVLRGRSLMSQLGNNFTISMYLLHAGDSCSLQDSDDMRYCTFVFGGGANGIDFNIRYNGNRYTTSYSLSPDNKIHHVVGTKENTTYKLYVDGELKSSNVYSYPIITDKAYFHLGNIGTSITKKFGNLILEKTVWTAQEVSDYYNQTKGNYGL